MDRLTKKKRESLNKLLNLRLAQLTQLNAIKEPITDNIKLIKNVLKGTNPIDHLIKHSKIVHEYLNKFSFE